MASAGRQARGVRTLARFCACDCKHGANSEARSGELASSPGVPHSRRRSADCNRTQLQLARADLFSATDFRFAAELQLAPPPLVESAATSLVASRATRLVARQVKLLTRRRHHCRRCAFAAKVFDAAPQKSDRSLRIELRPREITTFEPRPIETRSARHFVISSGECRPARQID